MRTGLDQILDSGGREFGRTGWLVNGSAVTTDALHWAPMAARDAGLTVTTLFAPEHGPRGAIAEGVPVDNHRDPGTGLAVCSLYASSPSGLSDALAGCDSVIVDLPDNAARYSTYIATTADLLDAVAAHSGRPRVVIADRPNLLGRVSYGPPLERGYESEVGRVHVPVRHGHTLGELARRYVLEAGLDVELEVVTVQGWDPDRILDEQPYLPPSPNMNCFAAQLLYLGTCLFEGTNISEGRGTANPFQQLGAPWLDAEALVAQLRREDWPGVRFRSVSFVPTTSKHRGELCHGVFVHLVDAARAMPIELGVRLLELMFAQDERTALRPPADDAALRPLDRLWGSSTLAEHLRSRSTAAFPIPDCAGEVRELPQYSAR